MVALQVGRYMVQELSQGRAVSMVNLAGEIHSLMLPIPFLDGDLYFGHLRRPLC